MTGQAIRDGREHEQGERHAPVSRVFHRQLRHWAAERPTAPFVRCSGAWLSYGELDHRSDRLAGGLTDLGVVRGDRVAVALPNGDELIVAIFALAKVGAIQVPLNVFLKGEFLRHQLEDSGARLLITDAAGVRSAEPVVARTPLEAYLVVEPVDGASLPVRRFADAEASTTPVPADEATPADVMTIMYTSGTTGMPKGCLLSHGYYTLIPTAYLDAGWMLPTDRIFTGMPLFHVAGQSIVLGTALSCGGSVAIQPAFSASTFLDEARAAGATMLFGIAAMGMAILAQPPREDEPRGFRMSTWIPMPAAAQQAFEERFETPVICEGYGQTECAPALLNRIDGDRRPGSSGTPVWYLDVRLLGDDDEEVPVGEVGEIAIRPRVPHAMFSGYWNDPAATVAASSNLWHHTGDQARRDEDGYLWFADRKKDAMRRRGENVSSIEVEAAVGRHAKVAAVAVHAVPSDLGEDDIKACIVASPEGAPTPEELFGHFRAELPYYAIPRYVEIVETLPVNAMGRVQKHVLRATPLSEATWDLHALGLVVERGDRR